MSMLVITMMVVSFCCCRFLGVAGDGDDGGGGGDGGGGCNGVVAAEAATTTTDRSDAEVKPIGRTSGSRYMARLRAAGADWGLDIKNNIRWMTVITSY